MELEGAALLKICRRELFDYLRSIGPLQPTAKRSRVALIEYLMRKFNIEDSVRSKPELDRIVNSFTASLNLLWKRCHRKCIQFLKNNKTWIDSEIIISFSPLTSLPGHSSTTESGRPQKIFSTVTKRSKLRKVEKLVHDSSLEEISFATEVKLRKSGKRDAANLLKELTGPIIIKQFLIPIGQLSEEVQESRHKDFRKFRKCYSRKTSRTDTNIDILHHLLISSDPVIVSLFTQYQKKGKSLTPELLKLLKVPEVEITTEENDDSDSDSD